MNDIDLDIESLLSQLDELDESELIEISESLEAIEKKRYIEGAYNNLIKFAIHVMDDYKVGAHHRQLAKLLTDIESGEKDRICVNIAPRHGKSQLVSIIFIAWYIGRNPTHKIMLVSHTADLAVDFGRKVRNLVNSDIYREVFPNVSISADSKSAGRWNTNQGGEFYATGVGSALAGRGAHLLVIDDPHSEQDILNGNYEVFDKAYDWFTYGARTRLMKNGRIAIIQCMTGDTPVLMATGEEIPLVDIRPGDLVASFNNGKLEHRRVLNHQSNGIDRVFAIKTTSGIVVRANERHPFLVLDKAGVASWVRVKDLRVGDSVVSLLQNTSEFTTSLIESITDVGYEEVFDVQIEGTENFIANSLVSHNTRWHESDLTGRVVRDMIQNPKTDQYHVVEFPAIMEVVDKETGDTVEKALWPEMFDLDALRRIKEGMPTFQWNAQYQQNPTAEEAALIKREWWRKWKKENPPKCEYLIITLDAAAETHNRADFTGITVWGVFNNEEESAYQIIALDSIKQRYEFPELKRKAIEVYEYWQPDSFIVEKKSAGAALYQEMRRMGIPVQEYTPHRGSGDKVARINSVADIVSSGMVWVPETRWAEELVDEVAAFPFGANDDLVDCTYMALSRFRQGGFIRLPSDMKDEQQYFKRRKAYY